MTTKTAARFAFRWMMATETGDKTWLTEAAIIVDEMMYREMEHLFNADNRWGADTDLFFGAVLAECRQWVPALTDDQGQAADWERGEQVTISKHGTSVTVLTSEPCTRCGGMGGWSGWPGFTCFRCGNVNPTTHETVRTRLYTPTGLGRLQARRAGAEEKRQAEAARIRQEREQALQEWAEAHADREDLLTVLGAYVGSNPFIRDLKHRVLVHVLPLSDAQMEAAWRALRREEAAQRAAATSRYVGTVGARLETWARVTFLKDLDGGRFGPSRLVRMEDIAGNILVTFSTSAWAWGLEAGDEVTIRGTVKDHQDYQGVQQTVLTRVAPVASV